MAEPKKKSSPPTPESKPAAEIPKGYPPLDDLLPREATARNHQGLLAALRSGHEARAVKAVRDHIEGWHRQQANGAKKNS